VIGWGNGGGVVRVEPDGKRYGGGAFVLVPKSLKILLTTKAITITTMVETIR
jgi:hypothetical protein